MFTSVFTGIKKLVRRKADKWLFQLREAEPGEVYLNQRRVFIVPTGAGFGFFGMVLLLLIGSVNYNLGLGYALTFGVGLCAVVDMYLTYRNLVALHLRPGRAQAVFAGEEALFELHIINRSARARYAVWIDFHGAGAARHVVDAGAGGEAAATLARATSARGWLPAPRVRLATRFPLGLFIAWSYWQPDLQVLVYPFPEKLGEPLPLLSGTGAEGNGRAGEDDFAGIRSFQPGDPMRRLAWRQIARLDLALGGQLVTKHFEGGAGEDLVLDFDALPATLDLELRLSRMARWVIEAEQRALPYAMRIGRHDFPAALGEAHRAACLRALALHQNAGQRA
ncbi:MAG: DUF58 domain-containing protein [Pseudomonadota bacterium]